MGSLNEDLKASSAKLATAEADLESTAEALEDASRQNASLNAEVSTLESARAEAEDELKKIRKGLRESRAAEPGKVLHLESEIRGLKKTVAALTTRSRS